MAVAATMLVSCGTSAPDKTAEKPMEAPPATIEVNDFFKNPGESQLPNKPEWRVFTATERHGKAA